METPRDASEASTVGSQEQSPMTDLAGAPRSPVFQRSTLVPDTLYLFEYYFYCDVVVNIEALIGFVAWIRRDKVKWLLLTRAMSV